jgi:hypothetical protein
MSIIRQKLYRCVGCEQQVETIGGYLYVEQSTPLIAVRFCESCAPKMGNSAGFREAAESRAMPYANREVVEDLAAKLGITVESLIQRSLTPCKGLTQSDCEAFDRLFQLPIGSHWNAHSSKQSGVQK